VPKLLLLLELLPVLKLLLLLELLRLYSELEELLLLLPVSDGLETEEGCLTLVPDDDAPETTPVVGFGLRKFCTDAGLDVDTVVVDAGFLTVAGLAAGDVPSEDFLTDVTTLDGLEEELPEPEALTDVDLRSLLTLLAKAVPLRVDMPLFTLSPVASRLEPAPRSLLTVTDP
jgi:hypothetical protein